MKIVFIIVVYARNCVWYIDLINLHLQESVCQESKPEMEPIKEESESPHASPTSRVPLATTHPEYIEPVESQTTPSTITQSDAPQEVSYTKKDTDLKADDYNTNTADDKFNNLDDETWKCELSGTTKKHEK